MTRNRWPIVCVLPLVCLGSSCQPPEKEVRNVVLTGSAGMTPLMLDIGKRFEETHPDVRIGVQADGSARGVKDTRQGLADIGMVARALKPEETSLHATPIGRDGVCFIVHKDNPVATLTDDQIVRMYTRSLTNWKQVGGADLPITLVHLMDGRALLELFLDHFKLKSTQIRADALVKDSDQALQAVAVRPGAIAYVSCSRAQSLGSNMPIHVLCSAGIAPTTAHVRDGSYPLARPLNLVTRDTPRGLTKEFIDFARSSAVADLIEKYHYVSLEK
jgi:phosphate transport system substrate-binding protein